MAGHGKSCGSCRRGDIYNVPADYYLEGYKIEGDRWSGERKRAFRTYVCSDHAYCYEQDGAVIRRKKKLGSAVTSVSINS